MSVAFTREEDLESQAADLPDRPISPHPNLVTQTGLAALEAELAAARLAYADAQARAESVATEPPWRGQRATFAIGQRAGPAPD